MPAKGDGISKRKDGRYVGRYTVQTPHGPKRRVIYGRKYKEVEKKLAEARGDAARGIVTDDQNLSVREYLDRWMNDAVRGAIRESTFSREKYLLTNHIKPSIGRIKLGNLNALHLQGLYRERLNSGLSGSTVQKMHHVVHKALDQAVKWNLILRNPADAVKAPTPTPKEMHPLSAQEARRLLDAANGNRLEALYVLAIQTGMRQGELLGLKWEDIDLDGQSVRVRRTLTRKGSDSGGSYELGEPKTKKSRRTVRLTERAVDALRSHRARQAEEKLGAGAFYLDQGLVFAGERGGIINPSNLRNRSFAPMLAKADLPRITFHDLRHTCASLLFQRNVHSKFVQELMGHASVAHKLLDTYSHMLPGMGGEAADAIEEALG
jgi:integrase